MIRIFKFLDKRFSIVLVFIVLLSYGQILWMQPWQDDNALFFKLAHIQEPAGFLGKGPFGEGVYKYAVTPFIPIYKLFGYFIPAYFGLALFLYVISTLVIYKSFGFVLGQKAEKIASFIYAAGYVISDGVWRLANSVTTSISIIVANLFLICYWKFYKERKIVWYLAALLLFLSGLEFELSRMHYFIAVIILFELIFLAFEKSAGSVFSSILRTLPFLALFRFKVVGADSRSAGTFNLFFGLFRGRFDFLKGFLSSLTNLVIPDWLTNNFFRSSSHEIFLNMLGLAILIFVLIIFLKFRGEARKLVAFFSLWTLANLYAYSSYLPNVTFATTDRYLAHSFFALTAIYAILYVSFDKKKIVGKISTSLIILLGVGNLFNGFILENHILKARAFPVKNFYESLKIYLPEIKKGDILYFDISKDSEWVYDDAISAAMMPNSTSFAWRYGVDRYDFTLVDDFDKLLRANIHSFFYSKGGLVETTESLRNYFSNNIKLTETIRTEEKSNVDIREGALGTNWTQPELIVNLEKPIKSSTPNELEIRLVARPISKEMIKYPLFFGQDIPIRSSPWRNETQRNLAKEYQKSMRGFLSKSTFEVNSQWQDNVVKNLYDEDPSTFWQSDRVLWQKKEDYVKVDLGNTQTVGGVAWMNNTYLGSIPTSYEIDVSQSGVTWQEVRKIVGSKAPDKQVYQLISFSPVLARFVRMKISQTAGGDSPMIAEFRVVPGNLSTLDLIVTQEFLENPYLYVADANAFNDVFSSFGQKGKVKVFWMGDKDNGWMTNKNAELDILYDGKEYVYRLILPPGGTYISKIKIADIKIPGQIILSQIAFHGVNFNQNH